MKASTIERIKQIYAEKKNFIDFLAMHGNDREKAEAQVIMEIAIGKVEAITA